MIRSVAGALEREPVLMAFVLALAATGVLYRSVLALAIYSGSTQPASLQPDQVPVVAFLKASLNDGLLVLGITLAGLGGKSWLRWRAPRLAAAKPAIAIEGLLALAALAVIALAMRAHSQLLIELESGLTVTVVTMASAVFGVTDFSRLFTPQDLLFLAAPLLVFGVALAGGRRLRRLGACAFLGLFGALLLVQGVPTRQRLSPELAHHPLVYFFRDALKAPLRAYFGQANPFRGRPDLPGEAQMRSIALVDPLFAVNPRPPPVPKTGDAPSPAGKPWNILIFVLESTGSDYIFDTSLGNDLPMPFLRRMADEGLYLSNHHASCNSSPSAAFSIFTGLYARPAHEPFSLQQDAAIPTLNRFLGSPYDCFLVHPSSLTYSFPRNLFVNNGFREMHHQGSLPPGEHPDVTDLARNEIDTIRFLIQRLERAPEPFLGIYWSFIPHHPYSDYGPEFRVLHDLHPKRNLYYNNLRALDAQLQRVFEHLVKSGLAERTLLLFVGDHGQAFGQHPGVWAHSFGSYSEMYRSPAIFWQPRLTGPRVVRHPTSHPDLLPTLLDLLGVPWDASRFQGESVLRTPSRRFIFSMDAQADYLTAIDGQMNKVTLSFEHGHALAFNLARDPAERLPLNEDRFPEAIEAILKFRNYQSRLIEDYNAAILAGRDFPPKERGIQPASPAPPGKE